MTDWGAERFAAFFEAVWQRPPFNWQSELARRVLEAPAAQATVWPEAIALPTAAGKTACIDIAVFALAAHAGRLGAAQGLRAPRRVFFVVDRRVIVDEAYERARSLATALADARTGILLEMAERLLFLAGWDGDRDGAMTNAEQSPRRRIPLAVQALRGGQPRTDDWAATPLQPTVIASTVDQVGSRLLFRGYGPWPGMWPVHAGLVGNDALILLDEAHCAQPMMQTLRAVQRFRRWAEQPVGGPLEVAVLSATPPSDIDEANVFRDSSDQGRDPLHPLGRRQLASKPARLEIAEKAKGRNAVQRRAAMADNLAQHALSLAGSWPRLAGGAPAVVVFCNRVDTARQVHATLRRGGSQAHLLTGRMRPIDKDEVISEALGALATARSSERRLAQPTFVVATQTLEVGADLDFDLLVTECASLDALRQRFGRLNRSGRDIAARAVIVAAAYDVESSVDDPVYGQALRCTWAWLIGQAGAPGHSIDFGISALAPLLPANEALAVLNAPSRSAPVLLPAHLDVLAQTAPVPEPSPDVGLFLHGPDSGPADIQVCWRADLTSADEEDWIEALLRCPPSSPECLAVPFVQMRRWLDNLASPSGPDVEGQVEIDDERRPDAAASVVAARRALRWHGREGSGFIVGGATLRPGDTLVIAASEGGLDELGTLGADRITDWGDRAHAVMRRDAVLRLHPEVVQQWPGAAARGALDELLKPESVLLWEEDPRSFCESLRVAIDGWAQSLGDKRWDWLQRLLRQVVRTGRLDRTIVPHPCGGWIVELRRPLESGSRHGAQVATAFFGDEDDAASSGHFRSLLVEAHGDGFSHLSGVGALASHYAERCGLAPALVEVLRRAGDAHDLGKADPRFQSWLRNGLPWVAGPLLAKSADLPLGRVANRAARVRAGYPEGGRHELLSVRLLESQAEALLPVDAESSDLLLHLVESHHGRCRPLAPVVVDPDPVDVELIAAGLTLSARSDTGLERLDAGPSDRYWRLTRRHGWWGLAWLETLLRLADHRRSEWEQRSAMKDSP